MNKIAIVTATRAEYGLLFPVVKELRKHETEDIKVDLIVTGTHLSDRYGYTVSEIEKDSVRIDYRIPIPIKSDSEVDISKNQAEILVKFTEFFLKEQYTGNSYSCWKYSHPYISPLWRRYNRRCIG